MKHYSDLKEDMILRDYLAYDRTRLALNRTFLAYVRTAIALFAAGAGLIILQDNPTLCVLGYLLIISAPVIFIIGIIYCGRCRKRLNELE